MLTPEPLLDKVVSNPIPLEGSGQGGAAVQPAGAVKGDHRPVGGDGPATDLIQVEPVEGETVEKQRAFDRRERVWPQYPSPPVRGAQPGIDVVERDRA